MSDKLFRAISDPLAALDASDKLKDMHAELEEYRSAVASLISQMDFDCSVNGYYHGNQQTLFGNAKKSAVRNWRERLIRARDYERHKSPGDVTIRRLLKAAVNS